MPRRRQSSRSAFALVLLWSGCAQVPVPPPPSPVASPAAVSAEAVPAKPSGLIVVAKVIGSAELTVAGVTKALRVHDEVLPKAKITTADDSSVLLVFANGATAQLGAQSELVLERFLQDPFDAAVKLSELAEEPSRSLTALALNRGELVGSVKRLRYDLGSSFTIQSPVGAAGVRGGLAKFRMVFRSTGAGQAHFSLSCATGNVVFQPTQPATSEGGGRVTGLSIPAGQEIAISVNVTRNEQGGLVVTPSGPPQPKPVAPAKGP